MSIRCGGLVDGHKWTVPSLFTLPTPIAVASVSPLYIVCSYSSSSMGSPQKNPPWMFFFKTPWGQHSVDSASTLLSLAKCMQINLNSNSVYCGISHKNCSWPDDVRFVAVENELSTEELSSIAADCSSSPSSDAVLPAYWPMKLSTSSSSEMHILSSRNRTTRDN